MNIIVVLLIVLLLFGAGGYGGYSGWYGHAWTGYGPGSGIVGLLLVIFVVLLLTGRL